MSDQNDWRPHGWRVYGQRGHLRFVKQYDTCYHLVLVDDDGTLSYCASELAESTARALSDILDELARSNGETIY